MKRTTTNIKQTLVATKIYSYNMFDEFWKQTVLDRWEHINVGIVQPYKPPGGSTQHLGDVLACLYSAPSSASNLSLVCWHHAASDLSLPNA